MAAPTEQDQAVVLDSRAQKTVAGAGTGTAWRQLSHELKTPMNAILGNIELLLDGSAGPLSAQARACVVDIQDAGQSLCRQHQTLLLLVQALSVERLPATRQVDLHLTLQQVLRETDRVGQPGPLTEVDPGMRTRGGHG